jgi:hypothetical protein
MKINQRKNMKTIKPKYLINKKIFKNKKEKRKKKKRQSGVGKYIFQTAE